MTVPIPTASRTWPFLVINTFGTIDIQSQEKELGSITKEKLQVLIELYSYVVLQFGILCSEISQFRGI